MTSLAFPLAARRLSPDHHAEFRVWGEKSDMAGLLFFKQHTIMSAGLVRAALYGAEGQGIKSRQEARYEACSTYDGASAKLLVDGVFLHRKMFAIDTEFHVELPLLRLG
jgi:hypothetical protein